MAGFNYRARYKKVSDHWPDTSLIGFRSRDVFLEDLHDLITFKNLVAYYI